MTGAWHRVAPLSPELAAQVARDGFLLLRGAVPAERRATLRAIFDDGITDNWPVPRGRDWAHALIDHDAMMRETCLLPDVLAAAWQLLQAPFFFSQVEGREPRAGGGQQKLHRDNELVAEHVGILVYLDDYGPANGATRVAAGTHTGRQATDEDAVTLSGQAGDILVFDAALLHGATCNVAGARRRSLLGGFALESQRDAVTATNHLRNVRMDVSATYGA
jgi:hypothetical protein